MTEWGVWFCGCEYGDAGWLRNKKGKILKFNSEDEANEWRRRLASDDEGIEVRRMDDGWQQEGQDEATD